MAIKNLKKALGALEKENNKPKKKKLSSNKHVKKPNNKSIKQQNNKHIKAAYQSIKLDPGVKKKLWMHRINTGETITAAINRIVSKHLQ